MPSNGTAKMLSPSSDWDYVFSHGITGDLCKDLVSQSRAEVESDPGSICWYAVWRFSLELDRTYLINGSLLATR